MRIRPALSSEVEAIMAIIDDGRAAMRDLGIDQWQDGYPYRETIETDIARGESYVVVDATDAVIATAAFGLSGNSDYDCIHEGEWLTASASDNPGYLTVHRLAVSSGGRGRGIAGFILDRAQRASRERGRSSVRVVTHPGNEPMRRSLAKAGFSECGIVFVTGVAVGVSPRVAYEKLVEQSALR